jgi:hypothetical protein
MRVNNFLTCNKMILLFCSLCAIIIFIYIKELDDILGGENDEYGRKIRYIYFKGGQFSYWTITHFLFFMLLGFICPNSLLLIIIVGILWELIELYIEYDRQTTQSAFLCKYINNCDKKYLISKSKFWKTYTGELGNKNRLFYCSAGYVGQILDIVFNIVGYLFGASIHKIVRNSSTGK